MTSQIAYTLDRAVINIIALANNDVSNRSERLQRATLAYAQLVNTLLKAELKKNCCN